MDCMDPRQGVHNKGIRLDSTPPSWPPIAPKDHGAERTRGRCLGRTEEPVDIDGRRLAIWVQTAHCRPQCCQKHDVVVNVNFRCSLSAGRKNRRLRRILVGWWLSPKGPQGESCRRPLPSSAFCPLLSALSSQPSLRFCSIVEGSVLCVEGGSHCPTSSRPSVQPSPRSDLCVRH
jgi:hypothetical protein